MIFGYILFASPVSPVERNDHSICTGEGQSLSGTNITDLRGSPDFSTCKACLRQRVQVTVYVTTNAANYSSILLSYYYK